MTTSKNMERYKESENKNAMQIRESSMEIS